MKHQPVKQGQATTPRTSCPTLQVRRNIFFQLVGLTSDVNWEAQETLLLVSLYFFRGGGEGGRPCSLREVRGFFNVPCSQQSRCRRRGLRFIVLIRED